MSSVVQFMIPNTAIKMVSELTLLNAVYIFLCVIIAYGQALAIDNAFLGSLSVIWYESEKKNQWKKALIIDTCFTELPAFHFLP